MVEQTKIELQIDNEDQTKNHVLQMPTAEESKTPINEESDFLDSERSTKVVDSLCRRIVKDQRLRNKYLHTACVCLSKFAMGWRLGMTGPTLPDLRLIMNENLSRASWLFTALAFGGLAGSLGTGAIYDKFNKHAVFMGLVLGLSIFTASTPWCSSFAAMVFIHVLNGACADGINTVVFADIELVWRDDRAPFLQAVNLASSIGAMLSPQTVGPFLATRKVNASNNTTHKTTAPSSSTDAFCADSVVCNVSNNFLNTTDVTQNSEFLHDMGFGPTHVHWVYAISAAVCIMALLSFVVGYFVLGNVHDYKGKSSSDATVIRALKYPLSKNWRIVFVVILSVMFSADITSERLLYNYLVTFLTERISWSNSQAANATTVFWISFVVSRIFFVIAVKVLKLPVIFALCLGLELAAGVIILCALWFNMYSLVWLACIVYGVGMSAISGAILTWISAKVCPLNGKISSVVFTIAMSGVMVFPLITGNVMSTVSYEWFIYIEIILTCFMIMLIVGAEILYYILTR